MENLTFTLVEDKGFDTEEMKRKMAPDQYEAWNRWFAGKTGYISADGKFCVFETDWQLYLSIRRKILANRV